MKSLRIAPSYGRFHNTCSFNHIFVILYHQETSSHLRIVLQRSVAPLPNNAVPRWCLAAPPPPPRPF